MRAHPPLTLVILAAGRASRYGRLKQLEPVGPRGAALVDYNIFDARRCGFGRCILVVPEGLEDVFLAHLRDQFGSDLDTVCVTQPSASLPSGRSKPWGTAHAVLSAAEHIATPFAVVNGDDAYGRAAFRVVADHLGGHAREGCLAAYRLAATLSDHGGVSRGICECDDEGWLTAITEAIDVRQAGGVITGRNPDGVPLSLAGDAPTSMNLWGFPVHVLAQLEQRWDAFTAAHGTSETAEFLLSTTVHDLVEAGTLQLRVLSTDAAWFGLTFPADTDGVRDRIAQLVTSGQYPEHLEHGLG